MSTQMTKSKGSGGCGCGGGGSPSTVTKACGCPPGSASCGCSPGVAVRPNFFAGQLLTDDDLSALTDYVVGRQRMHNRFLVGSGVSCGLVVTCHPCGGGKVVVQPGYAVDCCGNEIAVPCPVELDINSMARDLRFRTLGHDCGDPCPDPIAEPESPKRLPKAQDGRERPAALARQEQKSAASGSRRYCLYLRYCETQTDPVAPYTQDDACAVTCHPSRIREGFSFELRCPTEEPDPPSVLDRILCCIEGLGETDKKVSDFERTQAYVMRSRKGIAAYSAKATPEFTEVDLEVVQQGLESSVKLDHGEPSKGFEESVLRRALDTVHRLGSATARFYAQDARVREKQLKEHEELQASLSKNRGDLIELKPILEKQTESLSSAVERGIARGVLAETIKYTDPQLPAEDRKDRAAYLYAYASVSPKSAGFGPNEVMADFRTWLLRKLDECPPTGECGLWREVESIAIPSEEALTESSLRAADQLLRALLRYLLDCICSALLPPCPTCDDPAVKLACLDVTECEVDRICNLERKFLLTEHNLRYWIPLLHMLGEAFERVCCEFAARLDKPIVRDVGEERREEWMKAAYFTEGKQLSADVAEAPAFPRLARLAGLSPQTVLSTLDLGQNTARITGRDPLVSGLLTRSELGRLPGDLIGSRTKAAGSPDLAHRLSLVEAEVDKRLTGAGLGQTKLMRDLRAQLDAQTAQIKALEQSVAKLQKGPKP